MGLNSMLFTSLEPNWKVLKRQPSAVSPCGI